LDRTDLLVRDEDVRLVEHRLHPLRVGDHVRREVALVELHALGELELEAKGLALLDVHDAVLADLLDRVGDDVADLTLTRGDGRHAGDVLLARDLLRLGLEVLDDGLDGRLDAPLETHRVRARRDVLQTLADDRLGEHRRGRRTSRRARTRWGSSGARSAEHTSELQAPYELVCRLLLEK